MKEAFRAFLETQVDAQSRFLLAVSGGKDSVCMAWLMKASELDFALAHCNFRLRGEESEEDVRFVRDLAAQLEVPFFDKAFDTLNLVQEWGGSVQEVARELRYQWLESVRSAEGFDYVCTAHHRDDAIETAIFHFSRGCGLSGLHGILPLQGTLLRPLMFTHGAAIQTYISEQGHPYREDSTNSKRIYSRNRIRHEVIPILRQLAPGFPQSGWTTIRNLRDAEAFMDWSMEKLTVEVISREGAILRIDLEKLRSIPGKNSFLWFLLGKYGFNPSQLEEILTSSKHPSGQLFMSHKHELLVDRSALLLRPIPKEVDPSPVWIQGPDAIVSYPGGRLLLLEANPIPFDCGREEALLDRAQLHFPLVLRKWRAGDRFQPLGMEGRHKKIKHLLQDLKMNRFQKESVWVVESEGTICWVVGIRADHRFRITKQTRSAIRLKLEPRQDH